MARADERVRVDERPSLNPPAAALEGAFSVLKRPRTGDDVVPSRLIPDWAVQRFGIEPARSRLANALDGKLFFVVPGRWVLCLFGRDNATGACWPTGEVRRGDAVSTSLCSPALLPGTLRIAGLVPDGPDSVTIQWRDRRRHVIDVRDNTFVGDVDAGSSYPSYVSWARGGRLHRHPVGIPSAMRPSDCAAHAQPLGFP